MRRRHSSKPDRVPKGIGEGIYVREVRGFIGIVRVVQKSVVFLSGRVSRDTIVRTMVIVSVCSDGMVIHRSIIVIICRSKGGAFGDC